MLELKELSKRFGRESVFDKLSYTFKPGEIYGVYAPNGSGKSVLFYLISGLLLPDSGKILIDNQDLAKSLDFPPSLGMLLEEPKFLDSKTGFQNLYYLSLMKNLVSPQEIRSIMNRLGLNPDDKRRYRDYSLGMKQKLGIAAALMEKPEIILLDEPTNAIDEEAFQELVIMLQEERDRGALIIVASHNSELLEVLDCKMLSIVNKQLVDGLSDV